MNTEIIAEYRNKLDPDDWGSFQNYLIGYMSGFLTDDQILQSVRNAYKYAIGRAAELKKERKRDRIS